MLFIAVSQTKLFVNNHMINVKVVKGHNMSQLMW